MAHPNSSGRYSEIFLTKSNRRSVLKETVRDRDHVPPQIDPQPIPHLPVQMRTPRYTGTTPAQIQARLQAALERKPQDYRPEALERLLRDVRR